MIFSCVLWTSMLMQTILVSPYSSHIHYMGRFDRSQAHEVVCSFPASSFAVRTNSKQVKVVLTDYAFARNQVNSFAVIIDGVYSHDIALIQEQSEYLLYSSSDAFFHTIELCKRTESLIGNVGFLGFVVDKKAKFQSVQPPRHKILFIGNSITCGYGNEADNATEQFSAATENAYMSYAAIAARDLHAQYHLIAYSGKGIYRNWADTVFDVETMPKVFHKTLAFDTCNSWNHTQYIPSLIVINLGTNDFSPPLGAQKDIYIERFTQFLQTLTQIYPNVPIVCVNSQMLQEPQRSNQIAWIQESITLLKNKSIYFCKLSMQGSVGYGADWHPNIAQNKINAKELVGFCKEMGW